MGDKHFGSSMYTVDLITGILFHKDLLIIFLFPGILYRDIQSEMREKVYGSGQRDKA